jgi:V/A-type H+-transporting ATPase subunit I
MARRSEIDPGDAMFFPQEMTQVRLFIPTRDLMSVTKDLADQRVFHQFDDKAAVSAETLDKTQNWSEKASTYASLERRIQTILQVLTIPEGNPPSGDWINVVDIEIIQPLVEKIERQVNQINQRLADTQKQIEQLRGYLTQLEPAAEFDVDIDAVRNPQYLYSVLGTIPNANIERLRTSLEKVSYVLTPLRQDKESSVVWLVGPKQNSEVLGRAIRSAYLNPLVLPETYRGTPEQIIAAIRKDIENAQQTITNEQANFQRLQKEYQAQLQNFYWRVRASRILAETIGHYGNLRHISIITGWVPKSKIAGFSQRLKKVSPEVFIQTFDTQRGGEEQNVPVVLNNPRLLKSFQSLVTNYAQPRYEEVDPTFLLAFTYPLLFGAMFGDVGQGVVLALLGWLISSRKVKALNPLYSLGGIITGCGIFAAIFGFLYGSIFGVENALPAVFIHPLDNALTIMGFAIGTGVVLLSVGYILGIVNAFNARDWGRMFFSAKTVAGLLLYWSLILLVIGAVTHKVPVPTWIFAIMALISALAIMFSEALERYLKGHHPAMEGGTGMFLIGAFFELFETLISLLSNTISFVRVGAFAVAHVGLSTVIFIIAGLISPHHGIGYYGVAVAGNLFIIGFEGLIIGIQAMRLEYYEFFSKFFNGGGMRYEPLSMLPGSER